MTESEARELQVVSAKNLMAIVEALNQLIADIAKKPADAGNTNVFVSSDELNRLRGCVERIDLIAHELSGSQAGQKPARAKGYLHFGAEGEE